MLGRSLLVTVMSGIVSTALVFMDVKPSLAESPDTGITGSIDGGEAKADFGASFENQSPDASPQPGPLDPALVAGCAEGQTTQQFAELDTTELNRRATINGLDWRYAAWACADGQWDFGEVPLAAEAAALPSPSELAIQASTSVALATPAVTINPYWPRPDGRNATMKNAETWFWIDKGNWITHTPRVDAGPVWVQATITPTSIVITPNDGVTDTKVCKGKGTPLPTNPPPPLSEPSPTCSVRFLNQTDGGTWPMTVHVVYSVTWTGFDGSSSVSGELDDISTAPVTYPIAVLTAKPVLVDPNGPPATASSEPSGD